MAKECITDYVDIKMKNKLVLVLGIGRSGTSLVSGVLHSNGIWANSTVTKRHGNIKGDYVNKDINAVLQNKPDFNKVAHVVNNQGYKKGPWLIKQGINIKWVRFWLKHYHPIVVLVRRDAESILKSKHKMAIYKGKTPVPEKTFFDSYAKNNNYMDFLKRKYNGIDVWSPKIIGGDYSEIKQVLRKVDIPFNLEKTLDFIEPDVWHGES